jgi:hypothetical protein
MKTIIDKLATLINVKGPLSLRRDRNLRGPGRFAAHSTHKRQCRS